MAHPLPHRFRAEAVSRYETTIRSLCASWPNPILVDPAPLSVETFRCRFRDAVRAVTEFNQGDPELARLVGLLSEPIVVAEVHGKLRIGPKSLMGKRLQEKPQAGLLISGVATLADESAPIESPDKAVIQAIALLTQHGILGGARISGVTEEFIIKCFPEDYEGGTVENADGTFTIY